MVRTLADLKIDILFVIGGEGAPKIAEEANRQEMALKRHWHPEDHRQ
jgi:6-phosphofructokinase